MKSLFEGMGGTYTLGADGMYYPDLALPDFATNITLLQQRQRKAVTHRSA